VVKIRLWGLPDEVEQAKKIIEDSFKINLMSDAYTDKGTSKYVRVYADAELPTTNNKEKL
jgi:hypothetical protein